MSSKGAALSINNPGSGSGFANYQPRWRVSDGICDRWPTPHVGDLNVFSSVSRFDLYCVLVGLKCLLPNLTYYGTAERKLMVKEEEGSILFLVAPGL